MTRAASGTRLWPVAVLVVGACTSGNGADVEIVVTVGALGVYDAVAPAPVTPDVGALYFSVRNDGAEADRLVAVAVNVADSATLHTQMSEGATMHMMPLEDMAIPAAGVLRMVPGGDHVMITGIREPYDVGDLLIVTATFARSGVASFSVPVVSYGDLAQRFPEEFHLSEGRRP